MKKNYFFIVFLLLILPIKWLANYEFDNNKINEYLKLDFVQITTSNYENLDKCNADKSKYNIDYPAYSRSECFKLNNKYSYLICEKSYTCNLDNISQKTVNFSQNTNITNLEENNILKSWDKSKLDQIILKLKNQWESFNDINKYNQLLTNFDIKLATLKNKYLNNKQVIEILNYLQKWVDWLKLSINNSSSLNWSTDDFFCDLLNNCTNNKESSSNTLNQSNSNSSTWIVSTNNWEIKSIEKQEIWQLFYSLGLTNSINSNLEIFSQNNQFPNKNILDNYISNLKINYNSNQNWQNINNIIELLNKTKTSNKTEEFSINYLKENLKNIVKNTVWTSNNSNTNSSKKPHISTKLKKLTRGELSSVMYKLEKELQSKIQIDSQFWYANNYYAISKNKFSWRDLINKSSQLCPTWYKLSDINNIWKYNLEVLGLYISNNYDTYNLIYDDKNWYKKLSLWAYQSADIYNKLKSVIDKKDINSNLWLNWFYLEYFSKFALEKTNNAINKKYYPFYNNWEFLSINSTNFTLCKKENWKDETKVPWNLKNIKKSDYDFSGVKYHDSLWLLAAFNVIEYEYYMWNSKWVNYTYYEPIIDEKWKYIFYYEETKK